MDETGTARDLADSFNELGAYIDAHSDPARALQRIVALARETIDGCEWCAITQAGHEPRTLAASDDTARLVDAVQIRAGQGPCLSAAREEVLIHVPDRRTDTRWPVFAKAAVGYTPVRSIVTFVLDQADTPSALNLYAGSPGAFDDDDVALAALFAVHGQLAMRHLNARTRSVHLEEALGTSRQIGAAVGILMAAHRITEDAAFQLLRRSSQHLNRKLRDIAEQVTDTGELP